MSVAGLIDAGQDLWGGYCCSMPVTQLPQGASPYCQDVIFPQGCVRSRPRLSSFFPALAGNPNINGLKTYGNLTNILLTWDSLGNLYQEAANGVLSLVGSRPYTNLFYNSTTIFGREYQAFFNSLGGFDIPRQFDGMNWDRVSQAGPGFACSIVDSGTAGNITAGKRQVTVCFITRQGFITCPAVPVTWTAAGGKQAALTNIPIGPPNIIARLILFTQTIIAPAVTGPFYSLPTGTPQLATPTAMLINDNVTTALTVDFTDSILAAGFAAAYLFGQVELGACAAVGSYNSRTVWLGERNKVKADGGGGGFINLGFDGGFGALGVAGGSANVLASPSVAANDPSSGIGSQAWTNPGNVFAADGVLATVNLGTGNESQYIKATGYGFAIPSNATITGILVKALVKGSLTGVVTDFSVKLYKAGVLIGSDHANGNTWTAGLAYQNYGGSADLWGALWTPADINNANFGAAYSAFNNDTNVNRTASVDYISITIYYTTPASAGNVGPWGWTQTANYAGGASALTDALTADWGDAFAITGDGATAIRGQITQTAFQDYLLNPIIARNTSYRVRARVALAGGLNQGTLHINLQSTIGAFTTPGLNVQAGQLTAAYKEFDGLLTTAIVAPPTDLLLQVYADGTPNNNGVFLVDSIEIYPATQPFNPTIARISHANNPESFDGLTGLVGITQLGTQTQQGVQALRACWQIRLNLYLAKDHYLCYVTDDGQNEPASWVATEVSNTIGCCGPNAWDGTEEWVVFSERSGQYITTGSDPGKIMQEIQEDVSGTNKPNWNATNWNAGYTVWTRIDRVNKRILTGLPLNGAASPNLIFHMDYKFSPNGEAIIGAQAPTYSQFTGRILVHGSARKWSPWNITANSCAFIERPDGTSQAFLGNGVGNGKIYELVDAATQGSDDGVAVNDYYTTYGNPSKNEEEMLQLRQHRKICEYLTGICSGNGLLSIAAISNYRTTNVRAVTLAPGVGITPDFERKVSIHGERIYWQVGTNAIGHWFMLQRLVPCLKPDPIIMVRGLSA